MGLTEKLYGKIPKRFPTPPTQVNELEGNDVSDSSSIVSTASGGRYRMTPNPTGKGGKGKLSKLAKRTKTPKQLDEEIIEEAEDEAEEELEQEYDNISFASRTGSEPVQIKQPSSQYQTDPSMAYEEAVPAPESYYRHQAPFAADYEVPLSSTASAPPAPAYQQPRHHHQQRSKHSRPAHHNHNHRSPASVAEPHIPRKHRTRKAPVPSTVRSACSCESEKIIHASNCGCHDCKKLRKAQHRSHKHGLSRKLERLHQAEEGARCHCADCKKKRYKAKLKKEIMQEIEARQREELRYRHRHRQSRYRHHRDRYRDADLRRDVEYLPVPVHRHRRHRSRGYRDGPVTRADLESLAYQLRRQRISPHGRHRNRYI